VAEREEPIANHARDLSTAAYADENLAEVRVTNGHILAKIADPVAVRAIGITQQIALRFSLG
jgi:hypothetical protein